MTVTGSPATIERGEFSPTRRRSPDSSFPSDVLGPLLVWASKKDESRFVAENGRQALNFQITWTLLVFGLGLLFVFLPPDPGSALLVFPFLGIVGLAWLVLVVLAVVRTSDGEVYEYPLALDVIS